ncbi:MAG: hypothetical protein AAGI22_01380 [Planctomycetota bacterium]
MLDTIPSLPIDRSRRTRRSAAACLAATLACGLVASCSSGDDESDADPQAFALRTTRHAIASPNEPLHGDGDLLAYRLSEGGQQTDYNGDGDMNDAIAVRVNTVTQGQAVLNVATIQLGFVRQTLFLSVSESADGQDWNGDMDMNDLVLLHLTLSGSLEFYDEMLAGSAGGFSIVGNTVIYGSATAPTAAMESNVRIARVLSTGAAPELPEMALTGTDPNNDGISYEVVGSDGDIVFLTADESADGDLNGDGDSTDGGIFAVLDGGAVTPEVFLAARALQIGSTPTAVPVTGGGEWLVAFLVDEDAGGASLNDPLDFDTAWLPAGCNTRDTDIDDSVLFWFQLTDLAMGTPAVNTGLVGAANGIAYAVQSQFVGVVSPESDQGPGAGCILNGDGDRDDNVFRWVAASNPAATVLPVTTTSRLLAVRSGLPGGTGGVVRLADGWVLAVDEAADGRSYDGQAGTNRILVGMHNPSNGAQAWNFNHGSTVTRPVAVTWMAEDEESSARFYAAITEEGLGLGNGDDFNGDGDDTDALPTIPVVASGGPANQLRFPGVPFATSSQNAGVIAKGAVGLHRLSEAGQGNLDLNGDGDRTDTILQRFSIDGSFPTTSMTTSDTGPTPSTQFQRGTAEFGAFLTEEFQIGDINGDGDTNDSIVRYFRLP